MSPRSSSGFFENANHFLKEVQRPRSGLLPSERTESDNSSDTHLDQEALTRILEWLTDADRVFAERLA
jgi:hypothetical protein